MFVDGTIGFEKKALVTSLAPCVEAKPEEADAKDEVEDGGAIVG